MAGRKPLPLVIKQIKGTVQKCRTNPHEPRPTTALCTPPEYMSDAAKEAWNYAVANSPPGLLSALDGAVLERWANCSGLYREALAKEANLKAQVESLKAELDRQNRADIQYNIFQREADTNRQLYDALLQRYKEIGVAGAVGVNNIAVVEPAVVPDKPTSPSLPINLAIALI